MLLPLHISLPLALALLIVAVMGSGLWSVEFSLSRRLWFLVHVLVELAMCFCFVRDPVLCCVLLVVGHLFPCECCLGAVKFQSQNSRDMVVVVASSLRRLQDRLPTAEWELVEYCRDLIRSVSAYSKKSQSGKKERAPLTSSIFIASFRVTQL